MSGDRASVGELYALGARAMDLVGALARFSDVPGQTTRLYLSPSHRAAADHVREAMIAAGMAAHVDAVGNVVGRLGPADAPALLIGSHIDSVVDGGNFDGPLGVACGIAAVAALGAAGDALPFAIEVIAFGDEENVRFATSLSTSQALAGAYDPAWLDLADVQGIVLRDALRAFGGDPDGIPALARDPARTLGYLEIHIEQGPVLEARGLALGLVTAIAGATRMRCCVTGEAGHAGTVPMGALRRDALAGAAEMVLLAETLGAGTGEAVATVGQLAVKPGAVNVIPASVAFTLDIRAPADEIRRSLVERILAGCGAIASRRRLDFSHRITTDSPATPMDGDLLAALAEGAARAGEPVIAMPSGAGHDAMAMARLCPSAMMFVRCRGGISHHPTEDAAPADADAAVRVLVETIRVLAARRASAGGQSPLSQARSEAT